MIARLRPDPVSWAAAIRIAISIASASFCATSNLFLGSGLFDVRAAQDAGVRVICNLTAIESIVQDGRIRAVLVDTKTGRKAVRGKIFIDATGDGDVAARARAAMLLLDSGYVEALLLLQQQDDAATHSGSALRVRAI